MTDIGGAVLCGSTVVILVMISEAIAPVNDRSMWARKAALSLAVAVGGVAAIYLGFSISVEIGMAWRPYGKIVSGVGALGFAYCTRKAMGWTPPR